MRAAASYLICKFLVNEAMKGYKENHVRACSKYELATAAGVSVSTFRRWLKSDEMYLRMHGVSPNAKVFTPRVVRYLCKKYCIEI